MLDCTKDRCSVTRCPVRVKSGNAHGVSRARAVACACDRVMSVRLRHERALLHPDGRRVRRDSETTQRCLSFRVARVWLGVSAFWALEVIGGRSVRACTHNADIGRSAFGSKPDILCSFRVSERTSVLSRTESRDELSIETLTSVYQNLPECPIAT
jgi:hypothetical protein